MSRVLALAAAVACLAAAGAWAQERAAEDPWGIAVIVANSRYADPVPDVRWADRDAAAMRRFAIDVLGYREGNVFVLEDATLSQMTAMFGSRDTPNGRLHKRVRKDESDVLVFYSGHGFPAQKHGVLLPATNDTTDAPFTAARTSPPKPSAAGGTASGPPRASASNRAAAGSCRTSACRRPSRASSRVST